MIWHIFRKDAKLTWPLAAAAAGLHWTATAAATIMLNSFYVLKSPQLAVLLISGWVATGLLIITAVQHDTIPGGGQDWLVRPIRRRDLLLAKLLFIVLMVQLPVFFADVSASLVSGFSFSASLSSALQHSVLQMVVLNIPFLAFASVTRNLLEVVSGGVVLGLGVAMVTGLTPASTFLEPLSRSGLSWIMIATGVAILTCGVAVILALQYFRRRTRAGRILTGCITAFLLLTQFLPWRPAFAFQRSLSIAPGSSRDVSIVFDPSAGSFQLPTGALTPDDALSVLNQNDGVFRIYLPIRVTGLPVNSRVLADHTEVRLIETNGRMERLELPRWNVRREGSGPPMDLIYPRLDIPAALYRRIKDQPIRIEIDQWLTSVKVASSYFLPAIDGKQAVPGIGRCSTQTNNSETVVTLSCLEAGTTPPCFAFFLEHVPTSQRNPDRYYCPSYAPFDMNPMLPVSFRSTGGNLPFRDPSGLAKFPVDGPKLRESRAVIQVYRVQDHFSRMLVIPELRLGEWETRSSGI